MPKNIAIITQSLLSGGAEKQSIYLAKVLSKHFNVSLIVLRGNEIEEKFLDIIEDTSVKLVGLSGGLLKNIIDVYKIINKGKIEILFSYLASCNFINAVTGFFAGIRYRIGGIRNAELSTRKLPFERFFHNFLLTKTISNSYSAVNGLTELGFRKDKFYAIHNAFDLETPFIKRSNNQIVNIISVARFVPQKDFLSALSAINLLNKKLNATRYKFKYYLIGYGEQESLIRNKIKELHLDRIVQIVIKPKNLSFFFKNADIFLTTSLFEGLSNSVMEALSFSLPIVATPAGDIKYLLKNGDNGFICEMKNLQQITENLELLIKNFELRQQMGRNSYLKISKEFTIEKFEKKYLDFIRILTNECET